MVTLDTLRQLDGQQLALWSYVRHYGRDKAIHIRDMYGNFPFIKYLFSSDSEDMERMLTALQQRALLREGEIPHTYERTPEDNPDKIGAFIRKRLIDTDHSFVRDRAYEIIERIRLHAFLDLDKALSDKHYPDPFLRAFAEDSRLGRKGWWGAVCLMANFYDAAEQTGAISTLVSKFAEVVGLHLDLEQDVNALSQEIDKGWQDTGLLEVRAHVHNITPWKEHMSVQIVCTRWQDISLGTRDEIENKTLKALLEDATVAHVILPVGQASERDEDVLRSTRLPIFTPEDIKQIVINQEPANKFKELLRQRMDIELLSPYQTTGCVPEKMFFGRQYEIRLIAAHPGTNYAIYGGRRSGKTSLMMQLRRQYQPRQPVVFINCEGVSGIKDFMTSLCRELKLPTTLSCGDFIGVEKAMEPHTLLLIDEVDTILEHGDLDGVLRVLRHLCGQYEARCILSGSTGLYRRYMALGSPMYNFADPLPLGPFTKPEAMALAREPMLSLNVPFESGDSTVTQLVNLCGCFPNLIQLMCHDLIKEVKKTGAARISPAMVNAAFSSYAFATSVYEPFLENFNAHQKLIVYAALMVKSMSLESITERVQEYYRLSMSRIEQLLDELVLLFILDKQGASYRWVYEGFPTILRRQVRDVDFRIKQTIKEIENETQNR